ncbi:altronate dehydratase [Rhodoferax sp. AJA081-3]|uniref:UxaA family hydrolase n=1 Tax=Rhodoferax sp. AJA081-3 TaxID=2752316 RepID=UPI001AE0AB23|nr:altronate dehydratase family protein [Rhodoferax sp. AJA081-3]QTN26319.1 altronate dehydratase [Rhodoferax sp. AJA081-3]
MTATTPGKVLCIHPDDDMLVALVDLHTGETVEWAQQPLTIRTAVQRKHKVARRDCAQGDILKLYGTPVGKATQPIGAGCAVTTDNLEHYAPVPVVGAGQPPPVWTAPDVTRWQQATFQGVMRADGRVGTANHWLIFPLVFCENRNVEQLRDALVRPLGYGQDEDLADFTRSLLGGVTSNAPATARPFPNVDGVRIITHQGGCGGTRADARSLCRILAAYADHPNVAGVTVFSLGCQNAQVDMFKAALAEQNPHFDKPCLVYEQQEWEGGEAAMMKTVVQDTLQQLAIANEAVRQPVPLSHLRIGVKCGGSDGFSGITANPVLGLVSDRLVALGGGSILSEFPELCGVESSLMARCVHAPDRQRFADLMQDFETRAHAVGTTFADNPSPGNIRDGLITDAMKSAGAARKGGSSPIVAVLDYGEVARQPGLSLLCTPGNDVESVTALVSAGANVVLFTTGLGTPTGNPIAPVVKVSSNTDVATRLSELIDFDCGSILQGAKPEALADGLMEHIIAFASGQQITQADRLGQHDFIFWRRDISL